MKMKRGDYANGYNVQAITENGIILSSSLFTTSADQGTLMPSVRKLQKTHQTPEIVLADKGYSSEDNYAFCEQAGIDAYIPPYAEPADLSGFRYNKQKDTYTDGDGRVYCFKHHMQRRDGLSMRGRPRKTENKKRQHDLYKRTIYEHQDGKTGKKKYLSVSRLWQEHVKKQKEKLSSPHGKRIYKQRMHDVEGVFANIKKNLRFTAFSLRGLAGVTAEWTLISLAHNLKKIL
jgi:hypothetical protein